MLIGEIVLNSNGKERVPGITREFPYAFHYTDSGILSMETLPWHWHEEMEFVYVVKGAVEYRSNHQSMIMEEGTGAFVNSNLLHMIHVPYKEKEVIWHSHLLSGMVLSGFSGSVFEDFYVMPVTKCKSLEMLHITGKTENQRNILKLLIEAAKAANDTEFGHELLIRNLFSSIWIYLMADTRELLQKKGKENGIENERMKLMLSFINDHYDRKISLEDISDAANLSPRECLRCFKRNINMTPFQYLLEYRVEKAAELLAGDRGSIIEIALTTGFNTSSYFGKIFKEIKGCTPKEYRKNYGSYYRGNHIKGLSI